MRFLIGLLLLSSVAQAEPDKFQVRCVPESDNTSLEYVEANFEYDPEEFTDGLSELVVKTNQVDFRYKKPSVIRGAWMADRLSVYGYDGVTDRPGHGLQVEQFFEFSSRTAGFPGTLNKLRGLATGPGVSGTLSCEGESCTDCQSKVQMTHFCQNTCGCSSFLCGMW